MILFLVCFCCLGTFIDHLYPRMPPPDAETVDLRSQLEGLVAKLKAKQEEVKSWDHKGSAWLRALQKVPKRALLRVDPLKKGLLRLSPCFWVPKKCSQFLPCSLNCPWEQITKTSAPKSWFLKKVLRRVGHSSKRVCYVIEWVTQKRA